MSVTRIAPEEAAAVDRSLPARNRPRSLRVTLSTGEEVTTSGLIVSAHQAPASLIKPQIKRYSSCSHPFYSSAVNLNCRDLNSKLNANGYAANVSKLHVKY